jgi:hypothetical protein
MPKLTKEQRAELERQLAEDDAEDADDDEYEVGFGDGSYIRGRHSRVSKAAAARGFKLEPDPEPADPADPKAPKPKGQQGGQVRAFGRRVS